MLDNVTTSLTELMQTYGPLGVLAGSIIEEIIAPIPSTAVVLFAGFFLIPQDIPLLSAMLQATWKVMLPATVGMSVGSLFPYYVARIGEKVAVDRFGKLLQVDWKLVEKAQAYFDARKSDEVLLVITRAVPVIPSVIIAVFCGLIRMPVGKFLLFSLLGNLVRTFALAMIGWSVGAAYQQYADSISVYEDVILYGAVGIAVLVAGVWVWRHMRKSAKKKGNSNA